MVDRGPTLGGVCLNVGCIPSKALLHAAKVIAETKEMSEHGVVFSAPGIDVDKLRAWKDGVVTRLTGGLAGAGQTAQGHHDRRIRPLHLAAPVAGRNHRGRDPDRRFEQAIIAVGSNR